MLKVKNPQGGFSSNKYSLLKVEKIMEHHLGPERLLHTDKMVQMRVKCAKASITWKAGGCRECLHGKHEKYFIIVLEQSKSIYRQNQETSQSMTSWNKSMHQKWVNKINKLEIKLNINPIIKNKQLGQDYLFISIYRCVTDHGWSLYSFVRA